MKKFNLKLITPLILTLILQGCMPDSLTKFKKDQPKRAPAPVTPQVIDSTGNTLSLIPPTKFYYSDVVTNTYNATLNLALSETPVIDGSLGDSSVRASFLKSCKLDMSGDAQTQALPSGISLSAADCKISGTPTAITTVTTEFCSPANIATEGACEATPLVWDSTAGTCSNPDYQYATQAACISGNNKWHKQGTPLPYRIVITYQTEFFEPKTISTTINLGVYQKPTLLGYNQHDRLVFKVDTTASLATNIETTDYNRYGLLTSSKDITGVVKFFDGSTNLVGVVRVSPLTLSSVTGFAVNDFIYEANGAIGKIQKITGNTVYVERLTSALNFSAGQNVRYGAKAAYPQTYAAASGGTIIASVDDAYVFDASTLDLDNDDQYYSGDYTQSVITRLYEKGITIDNIIPTATSQINPLNGISYSITPALPLGLIFDTTTGIISGMFTNTLVSTKFTITATNPLGSISFSMYLSSILAPKDLSYTTKQLISVTDNTYFNESESLFKPIVTPSLVSVTGQVLRKYGSTQMSINTVNGSFLEGNLIDSGNAYYGYKSSVLADPVFYSVALTVSDVSVAAVGDYVTSSTGAFGRLVAKDTATLTFFVQYLNSSSTPKLFQQDDKICSGLTCVAGTVTIDQVESDNMILKVSSVASLKLGDDITATAFGTALPAVGGLSGYIHKISANNIYVSDIGRTQTDSFKKTQFIDNIETVVANKASITEVAHDNLFVVENGAINGASFEIQANLSQGTGVLYFISPNLPTGMTLNSSTGLISGTPTFAAPRKSYTITAKNLINESKFSFELETRDFFEITEKSGAPSFIMHKYGDSRGSRKCRINSTDIKNFSANSTSVNTDVVDIRCFLDAEEQDLHTNDLKFNYSVGAGVCEYVQVYPYSFWSDAPIQSTPTYTAITGDCGATPAATVQELCVGNYNVGPNKYEDGPNCDETVIQVTNQTWNDVLGVCTLISTEAPTEVNCGGKIAACLQGPVRNILSDAELEAGARLLNYQTPNGKLIEGTPFSAPHGNGTIKHTDTTNLRVANGSVNNRCFSSNADADTWATSLSALAPTDNPMAGGTNPYYIVNCRNSAYDLKARIRIVIRDWNTSFKIKDGIEADTTAAAPTLMNNSAIVFGKSNNDFNDWDDAYNGAAATGAAACTAPNTWGSNYKFPEDQL